MLRLPRQHDEKKARERLAGRHQGITCRCECHFSRLLGMCRAGRKQRSRLCVWLLGGPPRRKPARDRGSGCRTDRFDCPGGKGPCFDQISLASNFESRPIVGRKTRALMDRCSHSRLHQHRRIPWLHHRISYGRGFDEAALGGWCCRLAGCARRSNSRNSVQETLRYQMEQEALSGNVSLAAEVK